MKAFAAALACLLLAAACAPTPAGQMRTSGEIEIGTQVRSGRAGNY